MRRKQEIRDPLFDHVLVSTVPAHQLPVRDRRLHEQDMQVLERLRVVVREVFCFGGCWRQVWETELWVTQSA